MIQKNKINLKFLLLVFLLINSAFASPKKVLCYGDSITQGTHINGRWTVNNSWVNLLEMISDGELECINAGRSGRRTTDLKELAPILEKNETADYVIYYLGINDLPHGKEGAIAQCKTKTIDFIRQIREKYGKKTKIFLAASSGLNTETVTDRFRNLGYNENAQALVKPLNKVYKQIAKKHKCYFVNLAGVVSPQNYHDGLHPNINGQFQTAQYFYRKVMRKHPKRRIACVGDSITFGMGLKNRQQNCYPSQLHKLLKGKFKIANFGVSARTLLKKGDRPYWREKAYTDAKGFFPNIVAIKLGTNDSKAHNWKKKAQFENDYTELVKSFQDLPSQPKVYLMTPAPVVDTETSKRWTITSETVKGEVAPAVREIAKKLQVNLIDIQKGLPAQMKYFQADGVHPNELGAKKIAEIALESLKKSKRRRK